MEPIENHVTEPIQKHTRIKVCTTIPFGRNLIIQTILRRDAARNIETSKLTEENRYFMQRKYNLSNKIVRIGIDKTYILENEINRACNSLVVFTNKTSHILSIIMRHLMIVINETQKYVKVKVIKPIDRIETTGIVVKAIKY